MSSDRQSQQIPSIFLAEVELAQQAAAEYQQSGDPTPLQTAIAAWAILSHPDFAIVDATLQFAAYHDAAGAYFNHYGATNRLGKANPSRVIQSGCSRKLSSIY